MFSKICRKFGVPPMFCYLFIFILITVSVFLVHKYVFKKREGLDSDKKRIVYFYWEQCGHCKEFTPTWEKFVSESKIPSLSYEKYEAEKDKDFISKYGVEGYPTVMCLDSDGNKVKEYEGDRSLESLHDFAKEMSSE